MVESRGSPPPAPAGGGQPAGEGDGRTGEVRRLAAGLAAGGAGAEAAVVALRALQDTAPDPESRLLAALRLGDHYYDKRVYDEAFAAYREALRQRAALDAGTANRLHFRLAWIGWHELEDRELAAWHYRQSGPGPLSEVERREWGYLGRRLAWQRLPAAALGLRDDNVSALRADRDDLWVGTWSGGLARLPRSGGAAEVFRPDRESLEPDTVRAIEVGGERVWVGTYQGLAAYSKPDSRWLPLAGPGGAGPVRVEALREWRGRLYVGTLGRGLWLLDGEEWRQIRQDSLPGPHVSCLEVVQGLLAVGTLSMGVMLYDPASGRLSSLDRLRPGLEARNITLLLADGPDRLWIGTYGEGLYLWEPAANRLQRFSRTSGEVPDDWVLCGAVTPEGTWFGTFGGGLAFLDRRSGRWSRVGLSEGLPALDISALAAVPPGSVGMGTLGAGVALLEPALLRAEEEGR